MPLKLTHHLSLFPKRRPESRNPNLHFSQKSPNGKLLNTLSKFFPATLAACQPLPPQIGDSTTHTPPTTKLSPASVASPSSIYVLSLYTHIYLQQPRPQRPRRPFLYLLCQTANGEKSSPPRVAVLLLQQSHSFDNPVFPHSSHRPTTTAPKPPSPPPSMIFSQPVSSSSTADCRRHFPTLTLPTSRLLGRSARSRRLLPHLSSHGTSTPTHAPTHTNTETRYLPRLFYLQFPNFQIEII